MDECAAWATEHGAEIESGPEEYGYTPGYYAVFLHDPDRIKLEILHRPTESDLARLVTDLAARVERLEAEALTAPALVAPLVRLLTGHRISVQDPPQPV